MFEIEFDKTFDELLMDLNDLIENLKQVEDKKKDYENHQRRERFLKRSSAQNEKKNKHKNQKNLKEEFIKPIIRDIIWEPVGFFSKIATILKSSFEIILITLIAFLCIS